MIERTGTRTTARILTDDAGLVESNVVEQLETLIDHPAFTEPIRMMPDAHVGASAPVGFTMPLGERIVPEIVGVDVGCGMAAFELGETLPYEGPARERAVRDAVPMGRSGPPRRRVHRSIAQTRSSSGSTRPIRIGSASGSTRLIFSSMDTTATTSSRSVPACCRTDDRG